MSRLPWDPAEIGTHEADLDGVADRLTRHAEGEAGLPPAALVARIQAALDDEPLPVGRWWQRIGAIGGWQGPARLMAAAAVLVLGVVGGLALGELAGQQNSGSGPSPTPVVSPSATPSPTPSPSATPTLSPTPSPSPVSSARITTPPPSATEEAETPEPSDDSGGNSGPGGGGDNSGPGGG